MRQMHSRPDVEVEEVELGLEIAVYKGALNADSGVDGDGVQRPAGLGYEPIELFDAFIPGEVHLPDANFRSVVRKALSGAVNLFVLGDDQNVKIMLDELRCK